MVDAGGNFLTFSTSRSSENTFAALKNKESSSQNSLLKKNSCFAIAFI